MKSVIFNTRSTNYEIGEQSHLRHASSLARDYFANSCIDFLSLKTSDFEKLSELIQVEIDKLLADSSYHMVRELKMRPKIKKNKDGIFLEVSGSYFDRREAISFNKRDLLDFAVGLMVVIERLLSKDF